jgi:hypothetical protein
MASYVPEKVVLNKDQTEDYARILNIFQRSHCAMDLSEMGCGKTFLALKYAQDYNMPLLVICKAANEEQWKEYMVKYGIKGEVYSYNKFRGTSASPPKHGYLTMVVDRDPERSKPKVSFEPTPLLMYRIQQGMLVVLDEFQEVRNGGTSNNKAVKILTKTIREAPPSPTRYIGLSALPACKIEELINILRAFGLITKRNLYHVDPITRVVVLKGLQELINNCNWYDAIETAKILGEFIAVTKNNAKDLVINLYMRVVKPRITTSMPELVIPGIRKNFRNGFFELAPGTNVEALKRAVNMIKGAARFGEADNGVNRINFGVITTGLINFYTLMAPTCAWHARRHLYANPNAKYIYFCMNTEPLRLMAEALKEFNPMVLDGKTSKAERREIKKNFNAHDNQHRVLIANCLVGGVGTSFHDTSVGGMYPRFQHILPHYSFLSMTQSSGRAYRIGSTSDLNGHYVFGSEGAVLMQVLVSLIKKAHMGREIVEVGDVTRSKLPSDWPSVLVKLDGSETPIENPGKEKKGK